MSARLRILPIAVVAAIAVVGATPQDRPLQTRQVPGAYRMAITTVPLDVRVLDRRGRPVTDLTRDDFTILENGVVQSIDQFMRVDLQPATAEGDLRLGLPRQPGDTLTPQRRRVFLLLLGRGRLQGAFRGIDDLIGFVEGLLPQDQVAVLAYNRATDFSDDKAAVLRLLRGFRTRIDEIDALWNQQFGGLAAVYGSPSVPGSVQRRVDTIFDEAGVGFKQTPAGSLSDPNLAIDTRRSLEQRLGAEMFGAREADDMRYYRPFDNDSFASYVSTMAGTSQDLGWIHAGVEYLRYIEGEKHLVFLTGRGLFLPRMENDKSLAAFANDARVAIDTVQAEGTAPYSAPVAPCCAQMGAPIEITRLAVVNEMPPIFDPVATGRTVAEFTGGHAFFSTDPSRALSRLEASTRSGYLLGYSPTDTNWDGRYRRIEVRVKRKDVVVQYRHGYYGREQLLPYDQKAFRTYSRIASAGGYPGDVRDLEVAVEATMARGPRPSVITDLTIGVAGVALALQSDRRVGEVEVAVFVGDRKESLIGETWFQIDLNLSPATYQRMLESGITHRADVAVTSDPRYVKVVVYDHTADRVGSATVKLK